MTVELHLAQLHPVTDIAERARRVEDAGYAGWWFSEHYGYGRSASPTVAAAIAATATGNGFRVGTAAVLVRGRVLEHVASDATLLAEEFAGRVDLGVAGAMPDLDGSVAPVGSFEDALGRLLELMPCETPLRWWVCGSGTRSAALAARVGVGLAHGPLCPESASIISRYREACIGPDPRVLVLARGHCGPDASAVAETFATVGLEMDFAGAPDRCRQQLADIAGRYDVDMVLTAHLGRSGDEIERSEVDLMLPGTTLDALRHDGPALDATPEVVSG